MVSTSLGVAEILECVKDKLSDKIGMLFALALVFVASSLSIF